MAKTYNDPAPEKAAEGKEKSQAATATKELKKAPEVPVSAGQGGCFTMKDGKRVPVSK